MRELSGRQADALRLIAQGIAEGLVPTIRELGDALGIRSTNGVNDHLRALQIKGYLVRDTMKSRALRLTDRAREFLGMTEARESKRAELLEGIYAAAKTFQGAVGDSCRKTALVDLDAAVERLRVHDARKRAA